MGVWEATVSMALRGGLCHSRFTTRGVTPALSRGPSRECSAAAKRDRHSHVAAHLSHPPPGHSRESGDLCLSLGISWRHVLNQISQPFATSPLTGISVVLGRYARPVNRGSRFRGNDIVEVEKAAQVPMRICRKNW